MTATAKADFPAAEISRAVGAILPKGQSFSLRVADSEIGKKKIVRIVTSAWKRLPGWERIGKVLRAMRGRLSEAEEDRILRYSVLTPEEFKKLVLDHGLPGGAVHRPTATRSAGAKRLAKSRPSAGKPKPRSPMASSGS